MGSTLILANISLYNTVLVITITVLLVILLLVLKCSINNLYKDLKIKQCPEVMGSIVLNFDGVLYFVFQLGVEMRLNKLLNQ